MHDDDIIESYEDELRAGGDGGARPRRRSGRSFLVIVGALLLGCVLLVVEIFANRPLVSSIGHAQSDLRAAQAFALRDRSESGSFTAADATGLSATDPSRSYFGPDDPSTGLGRVSVFASGTIWAAAVQVRPGACFYILEQTGKDTLYGGGTLCTGRAALDADQDAW